MVTEQRTQRQQRRLLDLRNSLSGAYQIFSIDKFPMPDLALLILDEWQSNDEKHEGSIFADYDRPGLVFFGPPRQGKTQLACELCKRLIAKEESVANAVFMSAVEWGSECSKRARGSDLDGWSRQLLRFAWRNDVDPAVLIIDDIDKLRATASVQAELFNLIELATANEVALIVTTNVSCHELVHKFDSEFGEAIVARLNEFCVPVKFSKK